jgi:hypothetical protein
MVMADTVARQVDTYLIRAMGGHDARVAACVEGGLAPGDLGVALGDPNEEPTVGRVDRLATRMVTR